MVYVLEFECFLQKKVNTCILFLDGDFSIDAKNNTNDSWNFKKPRK
jgi:hypothetical protein